MQLSRRGDYGIRAMLDIASMADGKRALTHQVAERQDIPRVFLTKIIAQLTRAGLLRTYRGASGGVTLARSADMITLLDIVEAVEGPLALNRCTMRPSTCNLDDTCSVCGVWKQAQVQLETLLRGVSLSSVALQNHGEAEGQ
ncbi:MAG: Rrf2 family transcriptional regulator [Chloroflexi bacterium]|nr:Rrf2 family transcriptional regulator [Chloroflexota bacterium]